MWFTEAIARPCTFVRCLSSKKRSCMNMVGREGLCRDSKSKLTFVNEAQILLISEDSVHDLNSRLNSSTCCFPFYFYFLSCNFTTQIVIAKYCFFLLYNIDYLFINFPCTLRARGVNKLRLGQTSCFQAKPRMFGRLYSNLHICSGKSYMKQELLSYKSFLVQFSSKLHMIFRVLLHLVFLSLLFQYSPSVLCGFLP